MESVVKLKGLGIENIQQSIQFDDLGSHDYLLGYNYLGCLAATNLDV